VAMGCWLAWVGWRVDWIGLQAHWVWRTLLLLGALLGAAVLYFGLLLAAGLNLRQFARRG